MRKHYFYWLDEASKLMRFIYKLVDIRAVALDFYQTNEIDRPSELFSVLSDSLYFAKDKQGRFVYANTLFLAHFELQSLEQLLGKTDLDILPKSIAEQIQQDDQKVIQSGFPLANIVELVPGEASKMNWHVTTKSPLRNRKGEVVGIEGITRDLTLANQQLAPYSHFNEVVRSIEQQLSQTIAIETLADTLHMSLSTFERQFKLRFGCTPGQFIKKTRIATACKQLRQGQNISQVAVQCGFCDQSYFSKEFKRLMGMTPKQFQRLQRDSSFNSQ